ncbi:MAG: TonB-dependent receptor [Bacteroidales bacterium]|nr:TonB-dependent receptor [Bacteroidales bacterium]
MPKRNSAFRFRRFARAGWAAFHSLHREVTIGRLDVRVADCSLVKSATVGALLLLSPAASYAQTDRETETRTLAEVQISLPADSLTGSPEPAAVITASEIRQSNIHSLADLVSLLPGVDVRVRGVGDAQADLALRGGTFDQTVILLNGINFTDAQTGHFALDLPIDLAMVQRIELLSPAQLMARGIVAFAAAVNIVVVEEYADQLRADISGGSYGTADASLLATRQVGPWSLTAATAYHRSDGYRPNTGYRHGSLFLQAIRYGSRDNLHLQLGGQMKGFGSNSFYSTKYPDQYEATRTLCASAEYTARRRSLTFHHSLYGRLHSDRFELFRDGYTTPPTWYTGHNRHLASLGGLRSRMVVPLGRGELLVGAELRREGIRSNVLGRPDSTLPDPYTHSDSRLGATAFAGYHLATGRWNMQAVGLALGHSQFGFDYGLAAEAECRLSTRTSLHATLARTYRLPSFTDRYYHSATQQANPDLEAEHSLAADLGLTLALRPLTFALTAYYRSGSNIIDWLRRTDTEMWYAQNLTSTSTLGIDASLLCRIDSLSLRAAYSYCNVASEADGWISAYALDYLRHRAELRLTYHLLPRLTLGTGLCYRLREGSWVDADGQVNPYGDALLLDASAEYSLGAAALYAEGHNLGGASYRDHGGIPMPGRTFRLGLRLRL